MLAVTLEVSRAVDGASHLWQHTCGAVEVFQPGSSPHYKVCNRCTSMYGWRSLYVENKTTCRR